MSLSSVYFPDAKNGWAVGFAGRFCAAATEEPPGKRNQPGEELAQLPAVRASNRGWITADDVLVSEDGGASWRAVPVDKRAFLSKLVRVEGLALGARPVSSVRLGMPKISVGDIQKLVPPPRAVPEELVGQAGGLPHHPPRDSCDSYKSPQACRRCYTFGAT